MTAHQEIPAVAEPGTEKTIGRRQLLKALAAAGGAVTAASVIPGEWAKPVIEAGLLPAHAQSSFSLTATGRGGTGVGNISTSSTSNLDPGQLEITVQVTPRLADIEIAENVLTPLEDVSGQRRNLTDSNGQVVFDYYLCNSGDVSSLAVFEVKYSFADPATYGNDSVTVSANVNCNF